MDILQELKTETRPQHDALESDVNLLRESMTLEDYKHLLLKFHAFYESFEKMVSSSPYAEYLMERKKVPSLLKDLEFFQIETKDNAIYPDFFNFSSRNSFFGALYVLEGSTLGGMVLQKHFAQKFSLTPESGLAFFSGYQGNTMPMWKSFQQELLNHVDHSHPEEVLSSAKETFSKLHQWLIK